MLVVPAAFAVLQVAFIVIMPMVILPLYYKATPLPEGPFRDEVVSVLTRAGIGIQDIFVIDESQYSRHTNSFFTGLGSRKSIYLYDTLLKDHSPKEALAVVGHEAGHWRGDHVLKGLVLGVGAMLLGCLALAWIYPRLAQGFGWRPLVDPGSLPPLLLLALVAGFFVTPIESGITRRFEREADRAAVELTGDRQSSAEAEERLARTNHSQLLPHPLVVAWYYTHPPAIERIESARGE
jgi:STE24 endopeptidase